MDFYRIRERSVKRDSVEVYPDFIVKRSKDLMIRGRSFYAIWDEEKGLWSTDEYDVQRIVDKELREYRSKMSTDDRVTVKLMEGFSSSNSWLNYRNYISHVSDNAKQLDEKLTFADTEVKKTDYVSKRLPYSLSDEDCPAFREILETLYDPDERTKIEWCIGSIVSGDSRDIQKFAVLYGDPGSGKGTILEIIQKLFDGYCVSFKGKDLTGSSNQFSTEIFRSGPLVAIDSEAELSRIEDNTILNSIVSHEMIVMNEKHKPTYNARANCFLFLASNKPVKITDGKSGLIRRLIDITPSGRKIPGPRYRKLKKQVGFELGAIAKYCLDIYEEMGMDAYEDYRPINMMFKTDAFFNFVDFKYLDWLKDDGVTLKAAYAAYKDYCEDSGLTRLPMYKFGEELKNYFRNFDKQIRVNGQMTRSWYSGFRADKFDAQVVEKKKVAPDWEPPEWLCLTEQHSLLDDILADYPAQYAYDGDHPLKFAWSDVTTRLSDLDTSKLHHVQIPNNLIEIDFDKKDETGKKNLLLNLKAASIWPETYAETSKSGNGIHLTYWYDGDPDELGYLVDEDVELKKQVGNFSLRRKVSLCNDHPIAHISSGLPMKGKKMVNFDAIKDEQHLRNAITKALRKEIAPGATVTCVDYIAHVLEQAKEGGIHYDVTDLRPKVTAFASHSTNHKRECLKKVMEMKFSSDEPSPGWNDYSDERLVFFDIEVFPNMVLVCWKFEGEEEVHRIFNPSVQDVENLMRLRLVGFNCRRYDNHILYALYLGKSISEIYDISNKIVSGSKNAFFGEAYNLSYTDVYDFCSTKQSLKKWEIQLDIPHRELGMKWDEPVPESQWNLVADYCDNDVRATEAVFFSKDGQADWKARQILADIADMTVNDTTNSLTAKIIFGGNRSPQSDFNYRNMGDESLIFPKQIDGLDVDEQYTKFNADGRPIYPGYSYAYGKSMYRGEEVGEGGYVYAEPGVHRNVALLDIASMHPSSIVAENLFGEVYTKRFKDILDIRIFIKHKDFDRAKELFDGKLAGYLDDPKQAKALSKALKIAINSVYGLTSAKFDNAFRDIRNVDNIVAKRGALFMVNLKHEVQRRGYTVAHIKTDSIKIPNADMDIINFVMSYGKLYGYNFEHEETYDRMCLVNDAVYVAKYADDSPGYLAKCRDAEAEKKPKPTSWTATGTQFQVPFVFKTLFSKEPIVFHDLCETKSTTSALYLDMNEGYPDVTAEEKELAKATKEAVKYWDILEDKPIDEEAWNETNKRIDLLREEIAKGHNYIFVGKTGAFCPIKPGCHGGLLMREKDGKYYAAGGTTGYRWMESEVVKTLDIEDDIDKRYYFELADKARDAINQYEDYYTFVSDLKKPIDIPPWSNPCGDTKYKTCYDCPHFKKNMSVEIDNGGQCIMHDGCDKNYDLSELFFETKGAY